MTRVSGPQWCGTVEPPTTVGKVDDDMDATNETRLASGAPVQGSAPAELPFADDAIRVLRAAVKRARSEARTRGITRGQVPVSVGHLADALTRSEASTSNRKVSVVGGACAERGCHGNRCRPPEPGLRGWLAPVGPVTRASGLCALPSRLPCGIGWAGPGGSGLAHGRWRGGRGRTGSGVDRPRLTPHHPVHRRHRCGPGCVTTGPVHD